MKIIDRIREVTTETDKVMSGSTPDSVAISPRERTTFFYDVSATHGQKTNHYVVTYEVVENKLQVTPGDTPGWVISA